MAVSKSIKNYFKSAVVILKGKILKYTDFYYLIWSKCCLAFSGEKNVLRYIAKINSLFLSWEIDAFCQGSCGIICVSTQNFHSYIIHSNIISS